MKIGNEWQKNMMKRLGKTAVLLICLSFLAGCSAQTGTVQVESRTYTENSGKIEYSNREKERFSAEIGKSILSNKSHHISAFIESKTTNTVKVKFSDRVFFPEKSEISDTFNLQKNRTYVFESGTGLTGLEIRMRYN